MAAKKKATSRKASLKASVTKAIRKSTGFKAEQRALAAEEVALAAARKIPKKCSRAMEQLMLAAEYFHVSSPQELTPANYVEHVQDRTNLLKAETKAARACGCKR